MSDLDLFVQMLRQAADAIEQQRTLSPSVAIALDQPLEIHPISPKQAAAIVGCQVNTLRNWRSTKGWMQGVHYLSDGRYNATALNHWVLHQDNPEVHLNWCHRFQQARQQSSRRDLTPINRGKRAAVSHPHTELAG